MKKQHRTFVMIAATVVIVAAVVGVANLPGRSSRNSTDTSSAAASMTNTVEIKNYMFGPMDIKVKVGTTVTWTNRDAVNHTVTADTNTAGAPNSMDVAQGKSYSFTFKKPGTYTYHCFPHPYMHGTVEVTNT